VELQRYDGTLDLTPGTYTQKINTLLWTIDYTYGGTPEPWPDMLLDFVPTRGISIGVASGSLSQVGHLRINYVNDYLSLSQGPMSTFNVQGYRVEVTPLGLSEEGGSNFDGSNPWVQPTRNVMARFDVSLAEVPEPTTLVLGGMLLAILGASRLRSSRRKRAE
jgi:hypothetical protein